jgi:carboxyl-terminal processing protease
MPKRNIAWMLVVVVIALLLWQLPAVIAERDAVIRNFGALAEIRAIIHRLNVVPVDDQKLTDAAVRAAAAAMVAELHDAHARYLDPDAHQKFMRRAEGLVGGIGVDVAVVHGAVTVQHVREASPAERAGLQRGDRLLAVDGQSTQEWDVLEVVGLLNGEPDSEVRLTVQSPGDAPREVSAVRAALRLSPVRGWTRRPDGRWRYFINPDYGIAYLRLTEFLQNAASELDEAVHDTLRDGARAWILDLRENRGGLLDVAVEVADRFLTSGVIVSTKGLQGISSDKREWRAQMDGTYPELPMAVLVNEWSASSAEIVAGALRDHQRAVIVGERTYGKGSVQELVPLKDGGAIKLTTRFYYLPNGECIQKMSGAAGVGAGRLGWGVEPNLAVRLDPAQREAWLKSWLAADWSDQAEAFDIGEKGPGEGNSQPGIEAITLTPTLSPQGRGSIPTASNRPGAASSQQADRALGAQLAVDPQLQRALEILRRELGPQPPAGSSPRPKA